VTDTGRTPNIDPEIAESLRLFDLLVAAARRAAIEEAAQRIEKLARDCSPPGYGHAVLSSAADAIRALVDVSS
jgi:hypothetical protein